MVTKRRSDSQTATTISLPKALLEEIDQRAEALGLTRSSYLCALAKADLQARGEIVLRETPAHKPQQPQQGPIKY